MAPTSGPAACPDHDAALARGRARFAAHDLPAALRAYDEAIRDRPLSVVARLERARAALEAGLETARDLDLARSITKDRARLAEAWMLTADAAARARDATAERIALVLAERYGATAATARLGRASRCTATWVTSVSDKAPIARSWLELWSMTPRTWGCWSEGRREPRTEAEAKAAVCAPCGGAAACTGKPPWIMNVGQSQGLVFWFLVHPLRKDLLVHEDGSAFDRPSKHALDGDVLMVEAKGETCEKIHSGLVPGSGDDPYVSFNQLWNDSPEDAELTSTRRRPWTGLPDGDADADPPSLDHVCSPSLDSDVKLGALPARIGDGPPCVPVHGPAVRTYFDISSGRALLRLTTWDPAVRVAFLEHTAEIAGGDCDASVPFPIGIAPRRRR